MVSGDPTETGGGQRPWTHGPSTGEKRLSPAVTRFLAAYAATPLRGAPFRHVRSILLVSSLLHYVRPTCLILACP